MYNLKIKIMTEYNDVTLQTPPKRRKIGYWFLTALIAVTMINGGINDILKNPPYFDLLLKFGYPAYFSIILGIWKLLGVVAILVPSFPIVKEWAYAGFIILLVCALSTRIATHDDTVGWIFDLIFIGITAASWALRPPSRKLFSSLRF
jgi:uncharacterized membrane protein